MSLNGDWNTPLGTCKLPGTTDENKLGDGKHPTDVTSQLTRLYPYSGALTYEKEVFITKELAKKAHLQLYIERTKPSTLRVDGDSIGSISLLSAPHVYKLPKLKMGKHIIKLRIDNRDEAVPQSIRGSHIWSDATQTNWNGILGKFAIIGTDKVYIDNMQIYPNAERKYAHVKIRIISDKETEAKITYNCMLPEKTKVSLTKGVNDISHLIFLGGANLWSEYHPELYNIKVELKAGGSTDSKDIKFGVRKFETQGTQIAINEKVTFLRGTHDACVFPIKAYCPTDKEEWLKLFRKAKEYGINHYRFHSYTPTEAAFEAADEVGMYLQTELPIWGTIDSTTVEQNKFLLNEARAILTQYGNHPSFMSLSLGNELWGSFELMRSWLDTFRELDNRHLYLYGSNNTLGWQGAHAGEDYMVTCRVGGGEHYKTNTRTSFSFADEEDGGILNHVRPNTRDDFSYPVKLCKRPIIAHETCQFQMYPDYDQIKNYTGVLYPYNLEIFRDRLKENGLSEQAKDFTRASTAWALECYKADIEQCVRTPGFGGYQLLDIKDYPGQGSALCGILDVFMNQKSPLDKKVINVMQPIVPMLIMDKYCWGINEHFEADIAICNYTEEPWNQQVTIHTECKYFKYKTTIDMDVKPGDNTVVAPLAIHNFWKLIDEKNPAPFMLTFKLQTGKYENEYHIWVYPDKEVKPNETVVFCDAIDSTLIEALNEGKSVILTPKLDTIEKQSIGGLFTPDYWNYAMFKTISENNNKPVSPGSLGMLMDPDYFLFNEFPTEDHTDWQWWCVAKCSRPLILNSLPKDYRPLVQTIDNVERNHKLGILMEFRCGEGRILLSTTDLDSISQYVEGRAYKNTLIQYANSYGFNPKTEITIPQLKELLYSETKVRDIQGVKNITDYKEQ